MKCTFCERDHNETKIIGSCPLCAPTLGDMWDDDADFLKDKSGYVCTDEVCESCQ